MTAEPTRVSLHLDCDRRLVAAVSSAVQFQGASAGLDKESCGEFARASEDVCRETLAKLAYPDRGLDVTVETFSDRIELCIHHQEELGPVIGLDAFTVPRATAKGSGGVNGMELLERVDRVMFNTQEGVACTTLVKFLPRQA